MNSTQDTKEGMPGEWGFAQVANPSTRMQRIEGISETGGKYLCEFSGLLVDIESYSTSSTTSNEYLCEYTGLFINGPVNMNSAQSSTINCTSPIPECSNSTSASTSPITTTPITVKRSRVIHDHHYMLSPTSLMKKLEGTQKALKRKQKECRNHKQQMKRLMLTVSSLKKQVLTECKEALRLILPPSIFSALKPVIN